MIKHIQEAIPLKDVKPIMKNAGKKYKELYPELFPDGNDRQFFPVQFEVGSVASPIYNLVKRVLNYRGFNILNYKEGYATKMTTDEWEAYRQTYSDNADIGVDKKVYDKEPPKEKIGKLIQRFINIEEELHYSGEYNLNDRRGHAGVNDLKTLLLAYGNDPYRSSSGKYNIIISRHPYDIAGMSTDRSWESCMALAQTKSVIYGREIPRGQYAEKIPAETSAGGLIAYLVNADEKPIGTPGESDKTTLRPGGIKDPLNRPLARLSIKPYRSSEGKVYLKPSDQIYPRSLHLPDLQKQVREIVDTKYNNIVITDMETNTYTIPQEIYTGDEREKTLGIMYDIYESHESTDGVYVVVNKKSTFNNKSEYGVLSISKAIWDKAKNLRWSGSNVAPEYFKQATTIIPFGEYSGYNAFLVSSDESHISIVAYKLKTDEGNDKDMCLVQLKPEVKEVVSASDKLFRISRPDSFYRNSAYADLKIMTNEDRKYGVFDVKTSKLVLPMKFTKIWEYVDYFKVKMPNPRNPARNSFAYYNLKGELIANPQKTTGGARATRKVEKPFNVGEQVKVSPEFIGNVPQNFKDRAGEIKYIYKMRYGSRYGITYEDAEEMFRTNKAKAIHKIKYKVVWKNNEGGEEYSALIYHTSLIPA